MFIYTKKELNEYISNDWVKESMYKYNQDIDKDFSTQKWLNNFPEKRFCYFDVYGEYFFNEGKTIIDVGGGYSSLSRILIKNHKYILIDIMNRHNDDHNKLREIEKKLGKFWINIDFEEFKPCNSDKYDVVIAHDIFPNVDQRLEKFIKKFKPISKKMIFTLTCYNQQAKIARIFENMVVKIYQIIKRAEPDRVLFIHAPTTEITNSMLKNTLGINAPVLKESNDTIFKNKRIVYKIIL